MPVINMEEMEDKHNIISGATFSNETREKDEDASIAQTFIHKEPVGKNVDCMIIPKPIIEGDAIAKDKDCTFVAESLANEKCLDEDKDCTIKTETVINDKVNAKSKGCIVANASATEQALAKGKNCTDVAATLSSQEPIAKDMYHSNVETLNSKEIIAEDNDHTVLADTLPIEEAMENNMDCMIVAETLSDQDIMSNDKDWAVIDPVNSEKRRKSSKENQNTAKNYKENKKSETILKDSTEPTPIIIDEESEQDNDCTILDDDNVNLQENVSKHSNSNVNTSNNNHSVFCYDEIYKENKLMTDLIEKCLDMENSTGMLRVINRTLIPAYQNAKIEFKKSDCLKKAITNTLIKLDTVPNTKFTHLKGLLELLKAGRAKRKSYKGNFNGKCPKKKNKTSINHLPRKKSKIDVIDLDNDDEIQIVSNSDTDIQISDVRGQVVDFESSSLQANYDTHMEIDDTDSDSDVQINEQTDRVTEDKDHNEDLILIDDENDNCNKENRMSTENGKLISSNRVSASNATDMLNLNNYLTEEIDLSDETDEIGNSNKDFNPGDDTNTICELEKQIGLCNKKIQELDETEVTDDSETSPYLKSEYYQHKIVTLYKELCRLTGSEAVKRHKVRLTVAEGHHPGPMRCLENYINDNIDENGDPPFPDLSDVILCVRKANTQYNMGWSNYEIESEARSLFIHYGRTVQKRRQKREWKHLMWYIKEEAPDPADEDPILEARLAENNVISKKNEDELINRYVQIENTKYNPNRIGVEVEESIDDSDSGSSSSLPSISNLRTNAGIGNSEYKIRLNSHVECFKSGKLTNSVAMYPINDNQPAELGILQSTDAGCVNDVEIIVSDDDTCDTNVTDARNNFTFEVPIVNISVRKNVEIQSVATEATARCIVNNFIGRQNNFEAISSDDETRSNVTDTQNNINFKVPVSYSEENIENRASKETAPHIVRYCTRINNNEVHSTNEIDSNEELTNFEAYIPSTTIVVHGDKSEDHREPESLSAGSAQTDNNCENIVKRERLDIPKLLEELGDNFTATIIDIEDPFMVIEISDSSESDDET